MQLLPLQRKLPASHSACKQERDTCSHEPGLKRIRRVGDQPRRNGAEGLASGEDCSEHRKRTPPARLGQVLPAASRRFSTARVLCPKKPMVGSFVMVNAAQTISCSPCR